MAQATKKPTTKKKQKTKRVVLHGQAHVRVSFNNTMIAITDLDGQTLVISSAGACGYKGSKKSTPYAAQIAVNQAINQAVKLFDMKKVDIYVKGVGYSRDSALRAILNNRTIQVDLIVDKTTIAHGGVRPRKARRS